jgi:hypothetical protein
MEGSCFVAFVKLNITSLRIYSFFSAAVKVFMAVFFRVKIIGKCLSSMEGHGQKREIPD